MITLAGIIGSGKSSLTEILSRELGSIPFYEPVEDNPVLPLFYKGNELAAKKRQAGEKDATNPYAYLLQTFFLNRRFMMMKKALQSRNNILDRSIYEDAMFMRMNTEMGNATQVEYSIYQELLTNILEELNHVVPSNDYNLMILIKVSYDTMVSRIKKRGREYEQIEKDPSLIDYYGRLLKYYEEFEENYNQSEMLVIDGDKFNFVENIDDRNHILDMIEMKLVDLGNIDCNEYETLRQKRLG
ncbi:deoxynucleoside kinase [Ligilactobacillus ruminis]|jgi:deoxyadenosine/deoxycytidine kinase|uniref:Deoxyguanosine kinase n=1 Tax=Ligilactobacillus ruminis ATCC 25644 TaxID=525362 RepID=E7FNG1_9LACO|nr:deoxynucleoside kinase [Ligilactobacillus ruminis]EFZ35418.1 deoxyguanosine kinase [Ligilactobacillus ruminis ATCC 25644]EGX98122.1 deoxyguanosine kinase [Ligilactobacillus ruminis ATCC 25644]MBD9000445.1 deoxynucleoside kinase [Ligilactobacillus ruminis]TGJ61536.1 deoxynucleoside kinase [Ligilactobacillus ruminis]UWP40935.1 deoxynucleoside kinase [Ligilactobacillus ruminis]